MHDRVFLFVAMSWSLLLLPMPLALQHGLQEQPVRPSGESPEADTATASVVDIQEAIQRAIDLLDRLETEVSAGTEDISEELQSLVDEANQAIEIVRTHAPTNAWLSYLLGRAYALTGRRADAADELMVFVETREGRTEWQAYRILGDLFVDEFPRLAQANYEKANRLNPNEPSATFGLSVCALKRGDTKEAIRLVREAMSTEKKPTLRHVSHLAKVLSAAGRFEEALVETEKALRLAETLVKERPGAREPLLAVDARYQQLIDLLQARVNAPTPAAAEDYVRLASSVREQGEIKAKLRLHDALRILLAGIERTAPNTPPTLLEEYGILLAETGRTKAAVKTFEQLHNIDPENAVATEWLRRLRPKAVVPVDPGTP